MTWKKKAVTAASALLFAVGGMLVTASPAAADGPCPANRLCIWDETDFEGYRIATASTNACFDLADWERFQFHTIQSYDNNLSVNAIVWTYSTTPNNPQLHWNKQRTLVKGGFSSNVGGGMTPYDMVCMGAARP